MRSLLVAAFAAALIAVPMNAAEARPKRPAVAAEPSRAQTPRRAESPKRYRTYDHVYYGNDLSTRDSALGRLADRNGDGRISRREYRRVLGRDR